MNTTDTADTPTLALMAERAEIALISGTDHLLRIAPLVDALGLRIEGELDCSSLPALTRALASMAGCGSFCLDLTGLTFIDVGALRVLVTVAADLHGGHVLTMRSAPARVRRLLELTGWHETPGLRLQAPACPA